MTKATATRGAASTALVAIALAAGYWALERDADHAAASPAATPSTTAEAPPPPGSLYGRVTTYGGAAYEGPLRWGGGEEAFWGHTFNGVKDQNPWSAHVAPERLTEERPAVEAFGVGFGRRERQVDLARPFMVRFGDISRIEARGDGVRGALKDGVAFDPDVRVTLKSGAVFDLDRLEASDFDDGVRVWDGRRGVVDLGPREIRSVELLPAPQPGDVPGRAPGMDRLHGTVRTRGGEFTGFLQWDREEAAGRDKLVGRTAEGGELALQFDTIRFIARDPRGGSRVTLLDGREVFLSGTRKVGPGHRGVYVDDRRYGRVLVSWDALERVDFSPGGSGPAYDNFPPGHPLTGSVTTRDGRRLAGRLVYDLDESETTETLDAPSRGVDYTVPFGLVASVVLPAREEGGAGPARVTATVTLQSGEELELRRAGDLGEGNAGVLVFADGRGRPEHVPWADVERVDFDRPPATYPPVGGR